MTFNIDFELQKNKYIKYYNLSDIASFYLWKKFNIIVLTVE